LGRGNCSRSRRLRPTEGSRSRIPLAVLHRTSSIRVRGKGKARPANLRKFVYKARSASKARSRVSCCLASDFVREELSALPDPDQGPDSRASARACETEPKFDSIWNAALP